MWCGAAGTGHPAVPHTHIHTVLEIGMEMEGGRGGALWIDICKSWGLVLGLDWLGLGCSAGHGTLSPA